MERLENFESGLGDEMPYIPSWQTGGDNTITTPPTTASVKSGS